MAMKHYAIVYRGCTLTQTETTTDVTRVAFGRTYQTVARVWNVSGRLTKNACATPFLTSARDAREYVRAELDLRAWRDSPEYKRYLQARDADIELPE